MPRRSVAMLGLVLASGCLVVAFGSWQVVNQGINETITRNAVITASRWSVHLADNVPDLRRLADGAAPSAKQRAFIRNTAEVGDVFRWKLFNIYGILTFDTRYADALAHGLALPEGDHLYSVTSGANDVEWPVVTSAEGDGRAMPAQYAIAQNELIAGGKRIGFIEVYVNDHGRTELLQETFSRSALAIVALAALAFSVPSIAFLRRTIEHMTAQDALSHAASHDGLTGLLNRTTFRAMIDGRIRSSRSGDSFRVVFLDLDKFKDVNDTRGHAVGDDLLCQVAGRLRDTAGVGALAARLGGDEFALFYPGERTQQTVDENSRAIVQALGRPFVVGDDSVTIGASGGIATYPHDGTTTAALLKAADLALYGAKNQGRGRVLVYDPKMEEARALRFETERRLQLAVAEGEFEIRYQPLYRSGNAGLTGFEALLRLTDTNGAPIPPSEFIPIAEETELIVPLGRVVLERACRTAAGWRSDLSISVNLSPVQFGTGKLVEHVRDALAASGLEPSRLELEVTEGILISDPDSVAIELDQLKELGISLALDDFGTGYSSLSYLWKFPFDKLKIDKSFVNNLANEDRRSQQVFSTIVGLGDTLGISITAEGVETCDQADEVSRMRVDFVQGFFYGRPVAAEHVIEMLKAPKAIALRA